MRTVFLPAKLNRWMPIAVLGIAFVGLSIIFSSCVGARFDQVAIDNTKMIAEKLPALMQKATKPFASSETEAKALVSSITDAMSHAAATKKNKEIAEQWRILRDQMVQPFLDRWKDKDKLDKDVVKEATDQVKNALASILRSEQAKPR